MFSRVLRVNPKELLNSRRSVLLVQRFSRLIPPAIGYRLAYLAADWVVSHRDWDRVKAVRCNQWVVRGEKLTEKDLDQAVRETFRNIAHFVYDVYHYADDPRVVNSLTEISPAAQKIIAESQENRSGKILLGLHLGNFDLELRVLTQCGLRGMLFNLQPTEGGYQVQYQIRQSLGVDVYPIDINSLRLAVTRLREGDTVITMADWPVPDSKHSPSFFGRPSAAPVHYVYLALKANVPVVLIALLRQDNGTYRFRVSEPVYMQKYPDKQEALVRNAEMILKIGEEYIRQAPQQWAMSHPVWPSL